MTVRPEGFRCRLAAYRILELTVGERQRAPTRERTRILNSRAEEFITGNRSPVQFKFVPADGEISYLVQCWFPEPNRIRTVP